MLLLSTLALLATTTNSAVQRAADTDTVVSVAPGTRLRVETMGGDINVKVWDRNQVRIQATHARRTRVEVRQRGAVLSLEASAQYGPGGLVDYDLTVPVWMALKLSGMSVTVTVDGVRAPIEVESLEGDITVKGGSESVKLTAVNGKIVASGVRGRLEINSTSEDVAVSDLEGDLAVEAISGDVLLRDIRAKAVDVGAVSGDVWLGGRIQDGGSYSIAAHSGDIVLAVPEGTNATITTRVFSGELRAGFTLPSPENPSRRQQRFRLGTGSAVVDLDAFSGDIHLVRPADFAARIDRELRRRDDESNRKHEQSEEGTWP